MPSCKNQCSKQQNVIFEVLCSLCLGLPLDGMLGRHFVNLLLIYCKTFAYVGK